jgi:hypothetical protein
VKLKIFTASSREWVEVADITRPTKVEYAKKWGHLFEQRIHRSPMNAWERPVFWMSCLGNTDWVFFTGADVAITNQDFDVTTLIDKNCDLIICCDCYGINTDSFLVRNCIAMKTLFYKVWQKKGQYSSEQEAMELLLCNRNTSKEMTDALPPRDFSGKPPSSELVEAYAKEMKRGGYRVKLVPQKALNAYDVGLYGHLNVKGGWEQGDFALHVPGLPIATRIEALKKAIA